MNYGHNNNAEQLSSYCSLFSELSEQQLLELEATGKICVYQLGEDESVHLKGQHNHDVVYLLKGEVVVNGESFSESGACHPIVLAPERLTGISSKVDSVFCRADSNQIDYLISWKHLLTSVEDVDKSVYESMQKLQNPDVFMNLPFSKIEAAFKRMTKRDVQAGDEIMSQGDQPDNFYIIESGKAEVWQMGLYDDEKQKVAELGAGKHFGSDALVMQGTRNASIRIVEAGRLLVLTGEDFQELIQTPLIQTTDAIAAKRMMDSGERETIDVRYEEEREEVYIPNTMIMPLTDLRARLPELDPNKKYLTYCRSGKRSAVAAMIMAEKGIDALSINGGIKEWPFETESDF